MDFDQFWAAYPRKVGKFAALKAFHVVEKKGVSIETLLAGIGRYIQHKPAYADYCHPVTWLRQGRWLDDYAAPARENIRDFCQHPFGCPNREYHDRIVLMEIRNAAAVARVTGKA